MEHTDLSTEETTTEELLVDDAYIKDVGAYFKSYAAQLQSAMDQYTATVSCMKDEAAVSGEFSRALGDFLQHARALKDVISSFGDEIAAVCDGYLEEIDEKDQYLY